MDSPAELGRDFRLSSPVILSDFASFSANSSSRETTKIVSIDLHNRSTQSPTPLPHGCHDNICATSINIVRQNIKIVSNIILFKMNCAEFINNKLLHIDAQMWFELVQDVGDEITVDERISSKKNRVKHVFWNGRFYKNIYELASKFYINLQKHDNLVPKLPKNKFDSVKRIAEFVLQNRTKFSIADAHNHPEGSLFLELRASSKTNSKCDSIYIVSQRDVLSHFYQFWVPNEREIMKPTPDDKLRLMGILLSNQIRDYLPDIMGVTAGGTRQQLDASKGRQSLGWSLTLDLFVDVNYTVHLPDRWSHQETRNEINERVGEDVYEKHGNFNPNREDRITLPWTVPLLKTMFGIVRKSYNRVMERYTMGTGGGSGLPENYVIWQERDNTTISGYISQANSINVYKTII